MKEMLRKYNSKLPNATHCRFGSEWSVHKLDVVRFPFCAVFLVSHMAPVLCGQSQVAISLRANDSRVHSSRKSTWLVFLDRFDSSVDFHISFGSAGSPRVA